jgi:hypothetical protein
VYGGGYHPSHQYNRNSSYNKVLSDNKVVVVNKNDKYWGGFDDKPRGKDRKGKVESPISQARPDRSDLKKPDRAGAKKGDWKGKSTYAGADPKARDKANLPKKGKMPDSKAVSKQAAANASAARKRQPSGRGDRGYDGPTKGAAKAKPAAASKVSHAASSRPKPTSRAAAHSARDTGGKLSGGGSGASARAASARGRSSMSHGGGGHGRAAGAGRRR